MANSPNLLFIFSDRQRYDTMRCYGNDWIKTPNLNALSEQSFVFQNAYVTQAVCAPARSSIMTGLYPHAAGMPRNKLVMRQDAKSIAEMVSGDYLRAYFGKWHLGDEVVRQHGFEEWVSVMERLWAEYTSPEYLGRHTDYHQFLLDSGLKPDQEAPGGDIFSDEMRSNLPAELQMASFLAGRAASFIESNKDRPFILYVSFLEPHPPFNGPYNDLYDPEELPVEPTFLKKPEGASLFNRVRADFFMQSEFDGHDLSTEAGWRRLRANYLANITLVDDAVGKIVGALDGAGLAENTIVVFTSEHGDLVGTHAMLEMRTFYEEAARAPLMMRIPWLARQQTDVGGNFSQIDLVPTLLELLDEPVPDHLQGESRAAVLRGPATLDGNDVFMEHNGIGDRDLGNPSMNLMGTLPWRSVVTADRWKLNLCAGDQCELFDLNTDPYEERNLFNDPAQKDRIRDMAARVRLWQYRTGDSAPLPAV
jgi:arylsulfatase